VNELTGGAQSVIRSYVSEVTADPVDGIDLDDGPAIVDFLHRPLWRTPTWTDYERLLSESEYAAWVIFNRYYLNHFTVAIHNLPEGYNTIEEFNRFLEAHGFNLNDSGGKVKTSGDGRLVQSSTVAAMVEARFSDGRGGTEPRHFRLMRRVRRTKGPEAAHLPASQIRASIGARASRRQAPTRSSARHRTDQAEGT
jgi:hypothetical protein